MTANVHHRHFGVFGHMGCPRVREAVYSKISDFNHKAWFPQYPHTWFQNVLTAKEVICIIQLNTENSLCPCVLLTGMRSLHAATEPHPPRRPGHEDVKRAFSDLNRKKYSKIKPVSQHPHTEASHGTR